MKLNLNYLRWFASAFIVIGVIACNNTNFEKNIQLNKRTLKSDSESLPIAPWTNKLEELLLEKPIFEVKSDQSETAAKGWVSASKDGFIVYIDVTDGFHVNNQKGGSIWDGDAIQFGIDADGSGIGNRPKRSSFVGPNDASITFALTNEGPKAWAHYHGNPAKRNAIDDMDFDVRRYDLTQTTTYELHFKWSDFQLKPGISQYMAFGVQVNDTDEGPDQYRLKWGDGAGGNLRPGLFQKVKIAQPTEDFLSLKVEKENVWTPEDSIRILIGANTQNAINLEITDTKGNKVSKTFTEKDPGNQLYVLSIKPEEYNKEETYTINIMSNQLMDSISVSPKYKSEIMNDLFAEINAQKEKTDDELGLKHLNSIEDILNAEWNKSMKTVLEDEYGALQCVEYGQYLFDEIKGYSNVGDKIKKGMKSMVVSFKASTDSSVQFYKLLFPKKWDSEKEYPLIVDLHGAGNPYCLSFFSSVPNKTIGTEEIYENPVEAFILQPWGRGNRGYRNEAGQDIYDGIEDVKTFVKIIDDRKYLTGFSMGGYGSWDHMLKYPERWRAVAIAAGGVREDPGMEALKKLEDKPILIWHGENDGAVSVKHAYKKEELLKSIGNTPVMKIIKNRGHQIFGSERTELFNWLLSK